MKGSYTYRGVVMAKPPKSGARAIANATTRAGNSTTAATPARIRVGRETSGRSGKGVSVITGLSLTGEALEELALKLKRSCGAGGAVREGKIEIQGEHRDRLVAELAKLGFEAKKAGG